MDYRQGDIVLVNFNPTKGEEIPKIRPAIIVSRNDQNMELDVIIVVPLSAKTLKGLEPFRISIAKRGALKNDSDALTYHIRAISKRRVIEKIASVSEQELQKIKQAICEVI